MLAGNNAIAQFAKDTYAGDEPTAATSGFRQVRFSSITMDYVPNKAQEGVLTGNIGPSRHDTMGIRCEGNISTLARPDDLGFFLYMALGTQTLPSSTDVFNFTPNRTTLPSFTIKIDKGAGVYTYPGCVINTLEFSAQPEDYLNLELAVTGHDEAYAPGTLAPIQPSVQRAFKFHQGKVYAGTAIASVVEIADITSIKLSYNNNVENSIQTTSTGLHYKRPSPNTREITTDFECLYSAAGETFRQAYFKTDAVFSVKLMFQTDEGAAGDLHVLAVEIPNAQVVSCSVPVSDANSIKQSISAAAIDIGTGDLIKFTLDNGLTALY
jgi:hypothetical protein